MKNNRDDKKNRGQAKSGSVSSRAHGRQPLSAGRTRKGVAGKNTSRSSRARGREEVDTRRVQVTSRRVNPKRDVQRRGATSRTVHSRTVRRDTKQGRMRKQSAVSVQRRNRIRRLAIFFVFLLVFLGLAVGVGMYVVGRLHENAYVAPDSPAASYQPVACSADILDTALNVQASGNVETGERTVVFVVSLHNTSTEHPCFIDVGTDNILLHVSSGEDKVVDVHTCSDTAPASRRLLLDRDMTATASYTWNGHRGRECAATAPVAAPGAYEGVWSLKDTQDVQAVGTFALEDLTPPAPEDTSESETSEEQQASPQEN